MGGEYPKGGAIILGYSPHWGAIFLGYPPRGGDIPRNIDPFWEGGESPGGESHVTPIKKRLKANMTLLLLKTR
jgi:hypothetical protein